MLLKNGNKNLLMKYVCFLHVFVYIRGNCQTSYSGGNCYWTFFFTLFPTITMPTSFPIRCVSSPLCTTRCVSSCDFLEERGVSTILSRMVLRSVSDKYNVFKRIRSAHFVPFAFSTGEWSEKNPCKLNLKKDHSDSVAGTKYLPLY